MSFINHIKVYFSDFTATTIGDFIYTVGGCSVDQVCENDVCFCTEITSALERYDIDNNNWERLNDAPLARHRHVAQVCFFFHLANDHVLIYSYLPN